MKNGKEFVLYGKPQGSRYEIVLIVRDAEEELKPFIERAKRDGFNDIRVSKVDMATPPDFAATVNI